MNHFRMRRRYRIPALIIIAGTLFLCFQIFSYKVLNLGRSSAGSAHDSGILVGDARGLQQHGQKNTGDGHDNAMNVNHNAIKVDDGLGATRHNTSSGIRGVHTFMADNYRERGDSMFHCTKSKEKIPYSWLNDDYCDCKDSTDEPGTSACPGSKFYCLFQYPDQEPQHTLGSRVNDGVCDCCDGSDEWMGIKVFSGVHLTPERMKSSLSHAPCGNECHAIQKLLAEDDKIKELGRRLKIKYIETGKQATSNIYGPDAVFYQLAQGCFEYETSEYKYSVCPFKSISQQHFPDAAVSLGHKPVWISKLQGYNIYKLRMEGGDIRGCPIQRKTDISFICGLQDRVLKISEEEKCSYLVKFSTPAAC